MKLSTKDRAVDLDVPNGLKDKGWTDIAIDGVKYRLSESGELKVDDRLIAPRALTLPASGRSTQLVLVDGGRQLYRFSDGAGLVRLDLRPDPRPVADLKALAEQLSNQRLTPDGKEVKDRAALFR